MGELKAPLTDIQVRMCSHVWGWGYGGTEGAPHQHPGAYALARVGLKRLSRAAQKFLSSTPTRACMHAHIHTYTHTRPYATHVVCWLAAGVLR